MQVAKKELIQQGSYPMEAMIFVARSELLLYFPVPGKLFEMYEERTPSIRKIIKLLKAEIETVEQRTVFTYLKQFIKSMDFETLMKFLFFSTGSRMMCVSHIDIYFKKVKGELRVPFARTCGPTLELSVAYSSYEDFRAEFTSVLEIKSRFDSA